MMRRELSKKGEEDSLRALVGTGWICELSAMGCGCPSVGTGWALFCKPLPLPSLLASAVGHPVFPHVPRNPRILTLGPAMESHAGSSVALQQAWREEMSSALRTGWGRSTGVLFTRPEERDHSMQRTALWWDPPPTLPLTPRPPALGNGSRNSPHVGKDPAGYYEGF